MLDGIDRALTFLLNHNKISREQYSGLYSYYRNLVGLNNYNVNLIKDDLKNLFDNSGYVNNILSRNDNNIASGDNSLNQVSNDSSNIELVDVYDFNRGDQNYIKLSYSDGSVRIFENNLKKNGISYKGKEIFDVLKNKYGQNDITHVFHDFVKDSIEVKLYDFRNLSNKNLYDQLSSNEQELINEVMSKYPDKEVLSGPNNNMFIVRDSSLGDLLVQVEIIEGVYQVRPIVGNYINDDSMSDGDKSNSISHQKSLSTLAGRMLSDCRETGFVTLLLSIFLAGISSGIIFMIILNLLA